MQKFCFLYAGLRFKYNISFVCCLLMERVGNVLTLVLKNNLSHSYFSAVDWVSNMT
jgi:hypothetical protein